MWEIQIHMLLCDIIMSRSYNPSIYTIKTKNLEKKSHKYNPINLSHLSRNRRLSDWAEVYFHTTYGKKGRVYKINHIRLLREISLFPNIINSDTLATLIYKHFVS